VPKEHFSVRWTGRLTAPASGRYHLFLSGDDGYRVILDGKTIMDRWRDGVTVGRAVLNLEGGKEYALEVDYFQNGGAATAVLNWMTPDRKAFSPAIEAARKADIAVVCVSTAHQEGEGNDRESMDLPNGQDELISAIADANRNTAVVLNNGGPVTLTPWLSNAPAVVETWFPGEEGGAALAKVLFGDSNPSGKLPMTFAARREDYPDYGHFPGTNGIVEYAEGIYVGYRHFDKAEIQPIYPFGYGLSYTTFSYSNPRLSSATITGEQTVTASVDVTNTGTRSGDEVVELYIHDPMPRIDKPVRELKGFAHVSLTPGQTVPATIALTPRDLAYFDVAGKQWKADAGTYEVEFAASSRDIRQTATLTLPVTWTEAVPLSGQF
jgi:beta-glucosidase